MTYLQALEMPSHFISRSMAFAEAHAIIWTVENWGDIIGGISPRPPGPPPDTSLFGNHEWFSYEAAKKYTEAWTNSVGPSAPFGYMDNPEVEEAYNTFLPTIVRIGYESIPWVMLPTVLRGAYGALEIPASVPGIVSRGPVRLLRGSMRWGIRTDEKMARGIAMGLRGGLGLPARMIPLARYTLKHKGQVVTSAYGRGLIAETTLDKQLLNWVLKRTAYGPGQANKAWQLLYNKHGRAIGNAYRVNLKKAELQLAGKGLAKEALAYESGALAARMTVNDITKSGTHELAAIAKKLLRAKPVTSDPYPYQLAREKVAGAGGTLTKSTEGGDLLTISLANGETYTGNIQQITNMIDHGTMTGLVGRQKGDALVRLLGKQASMDDDEKWLFNRILQEMPQTVKDQAYNSFIRSRLHIQGPASYIKD